MLMIITLCQLISYLEIKTEKEVITLSEELEVVRDYAVFNNTHIEMLAIPRNVKAIGNNAFKNCNSMKYLYYLGYEEPQIGTDAFLGVNSVSEVKVKEEYQGEKFGDYEIEKQTTEIYTVKNQYFDLFIILT